MTEDKQIEKMAKITCQMYRGEKEKKCAGVQECDCKCLHYNRCEALYNLGYCKASDVALGVIVEIKEATENHIKAISRLEPQNDYCAGGKKALEMTLKVLAELKKKYESEKDNG